MNESEISDHLNLSLIKELIEVLGDEYTALLETFKEDSESRILSISEYLQASLDSDNKSECSTKIMKKAHGFKGSASSIGAYRLYDLCRSMENKAKTFDLESVRLLLPDVDREYQKVLEALSCLVKS